MNVLVKRMGEIFYNIYLHQVITVPILSYSFVNYILMKLGGNRIKIWISVKQIFLHAEKKCTFMVSGSEKVPALTPTWIPSNFLGC